MQHCAFSHFFITAPLLFEEFDNPSMTPDEHSTNNDLVNTNMQGSPKPLKICMIVLPAKSSDLISSSVSNGKNDVIYLKEVCFCIYLVYPRGKL
jgi:hypothetical protein